MQEPIQEIFNPKVYLVNKKSGEKTQISNMHVKLPKDYYYELEVTGRTENPNKKSFVWWFKNDWDPLPPDWSLPNSPMWLRKINWWFRNPMENFQRYVVGICDKNYTFYTVRCDGFTKDGELDGWELGYTKCLPWISYNSKNFVFYIFAYFFIFTTRTYNACVSRFKYIIKYIVIMTT